MKKKYNVVWGTDSSGRIELPFTFDMLNIGVAWLGGSKVNERKLNAVEKELRKRLYTLSDEVVNEILGEYFYDEEDEEWLAVASREEKLCWVVNLVEYNLREEVDGDNWEEKCQLFEMVA